MIIGEQGAKKQLENIFFNNSKVEPVKKTDNENITEE
jgi:hypothetical protein